MQSPVNTDDEEQALNSRLTAEPHSILAHVQLGDRRRREGKADLASYYYRRAIALAECQSVSGAAADAVARAETLLAEIQSQTFERRKAIMTERGFPPEQWSGRFRDAVETAAGERKVYPSQPTDFHYPGLPTIQFFDPADFDWAAAVEGAAAHIRGELLADLAKGSLDFRAYIQSHSVVPGANQTLLDNHDWSILSLSENGWIAPRIAERFPRTLEAVREAPLPGIHGWGPTVVFSMLKAGAHIPAHNGMFNTRLICHLPLIVSSGCRFRVGNEVREWEEGKLLIFDDTIEHEAWNNSPDDRVVLIFDVWRPELNDQEKAELTALFHI